MKIPGIMTPIYYLPACAGYAKSYNLLNHVHEVIDPPSHFSGYLDSAAD